MSNIPVFYRKLSGEERSKFHGSGYKEKNASAMASELMSSKCDERFDEEQILVVRSLPWRSEELEDVVALLDEKRTATQSDRGKRQTRKRVRRVSSPRAVPARLNATLLRAIQPAELDSTFIFSRTDLAKTFGVKYFVFIVRYCR